MCLNALEELWRNSEFFIPHESIDFLLSHPYGLSFSPTVPQRHHLALSNAMCEKDEDARAASAKILTKWRPQVLTEQGKTGYKTETNGTKPSLAPESAENNAASAGSEPVKPLQSHPVAAAG